MERAQRDAARRAARGVVRAGRARAARARQGEREEQRRGEQRQRAHLAARRGQGGCSGSVGQRMEREQSSALCGASLTTDASIPFSPAPLPPHLQHAEGEPARPALAHEAHPRVEGREQRPHVAAHHRQQDKRPRLRGRVGMRAGMGSRSWRAAVHSIARSRQRTRPRRVHRSLPAAAPRRGRHSTPAPHHNHACARTCA